MRKLSSEQAAASMRWLSGDTWPSSEGATGYDHADGWPAAAWVLNAIYECDDWPSNLTHHEVRQLSIASGLTEPTMVGDVNLDDLAITPGTGLGFAEKPPGPWRRVMWADLGRRDGFEFGAFSGRWPELHYTPHIEWDDPNVIPSASWPRISLTESRSWPVNILPPTEGSLDEETMLALIKVLNGHTDPTIAQSCGFYYGPVAFMREGATVYEGRLDDSPGLVTAQQGTQLTPNNVWPADQTWLVYTDYDLMATRVSGTRALIDGLCADGNLDSVRAGASSDHNR